MSFKCLFWCLVSYHITYYYYYMTYYIIASISTVTLIDGVIINVEEFEGRSVSFQCSHTYAWSNNKYFCIDPCKSTGDILVTVESGRRAESGRIALVDSGDGFFTVTFSNLQLSDSQKYWCAVERTGFDTYAEVHLTVKKGRYTWIRLILYLYLHSCRYNSQFVG